MKSADPLECLRGKRIVFVGDSTARFEYLTLVLWAETGVLPMCDLPALACWSTETHTRVSSGAVPPTRAGCEYGTQRWDTFYNWSNAMLNGRETCDCAFTHGRRENRVYENKALGFFAAFYFWMGGNIYGLGEATDPRCPAGASLPLREDRNRSSWSLRPEELVRATARLRPTHLIVGPGWWRVQTPSTEFWNALAAAGVAAVAPQGGAVYFRTSLRPVDAHASCRGWSACVARDPDPSPLLQQGWKMYDVNAYLRGRYNASDERFDSLLFADAIHLNPGANAELVSGLLAHTLCPSRLLPGPQDDAPLPPGVGVAITGSLGPHCPHLRTPPTRNAACMEGQQPLV